MATRAATSGSKGAGSRGTQKSLGGSATCGNAHANSESQRAGWKRSSVWMGERRGDSVKQHERQTSQRKMGAQKRAHGGANQLRFLATSPHRPRTPAFLLLRCTRACVSFVPRWLPPSSIDLTTQWPRGCLARPLAGWTKEEHEANEATPDNRLPAHFEPSPAPCSVRALPPTTTRLPCSSVFPVAKAARRGRAAEAECPLAVAPGRPSGSSHSFPCRRTWLGGARAGLSSCCAGVGSGDRAQSTCTQPTRRGEEARGAATNTTEPGDRHSQID